MAIFNGRKGNAKWDTEDGVAPVTFLHIQSWKADVPLELTEVTSMQDVAKTYLAGFYNWTAEVTCNADDAGNQIAYSGNNGLGDEDAGAGSPVELQLWFEDTLAEGALQGDAVCVGILNSQDSGGVAKVTYKFANKGPISYVTA